MCGRVKNGGGRGWGWWKGEKGKKVKGIKRRREKGGGRS